MAKVKRKIGKTLRTSTSNPPNINPDQPVQLHLVVTRQTGDTERYKLGEAPDLIYAAAYRRRLAKVKCPKRAA